MRHFLVGTDWWTDCDDAVAMRLLARAHRAGQIGLDGIAINACMEASAASLEGFLRTEGVTDVPIGLDVEAVDFGGEPPYQKRLLAYAWRIRSNEDAMPAVRLYRSVLAQCSEPMELIEIGYLQVLAQVLASPPDDLSDKSGRELIRENVRKIWIMAGKWDEQGGKENNFARNARAGKAGAYVCQTCPVPITFLGWEVGASVITGGTLAETDVLHQVLADHHSADGRSSWDPMLCLLALIGDEQEAGYRSVRGVARVDAETGCNFFEPCADGAHRYVVKDRADAFYQAAIETRIR